MCPPRLYALLKDSLHNLHFMGFAPSSELSPTECFPIRSSGIVPNFFLPFYPGFLSYFKWRLVLNEQPYTDKVLLDSFSVIVSSARIVF